MAGLGRRCMFRWVGGLQQLGLIVVLGVDLGEMQNGDHVEESGVVLVVGDPVFGAMIPQKP